MSDLILALTALGYTLVGDLVGGAVLDLRRDRSHR